MFIAEEPAPIDGGSLYKIARSDRPWAAVPLAIHFERRVAYSPKHTNQPRNSHRSSLPMLFHGRHHSQETIAENMDDAETKHVIGTVLFLAVHCVAL
jgi:hypothetical protein